MCLHVGYNLRMEVNLVKPHSCFPPDFKVEFIFNGLNYNRIRPRLKEASSIKGKYVSLFGQSWTDLFHRLLSEAWWGNWWLKEILVWWDRTAGWLFLITSDYCLQWLLCDSAVVKMEKKRKMDVLIVLSLRNRTLFLSFPNLSEGNLKIIN